MPGTDSTNTASENSADTPRGPIGVGAEAAEGIHDVDMVGGHERSGLGHRTTGRSFREGAERSGSEPLRERSWNHESGYGGKGGEPRTSSEQRELAEQDVSVTPVAETRPSENNPGGVTAMTGYAGPIEKQTLENANFRQVLFTGQHSQLVVMCLQPGEETGREMHQQVDQFFRLEQGEATFVLNESEEHLVGVGDAVVVPAGTYHNVQNTSQTTSLRLYTIYSPPNHPKGTVHRTKADAEAAELAEVHP